MAFDDMPEPGLLHMNGVLAVGYFGSRQWLP